MRPEPTLKQLHELGPAPAATDFDLAARYAPVIKFDAREPFLPSAVGFTVFRADGASPSFPRRVQLAAPDRPSAATAIEYAIWWDWDIGHLYELEHVWVYQDARGHVVWSEASWHGGYNAMLVDGTPLPGERLTVYSEPGKHAFASSPESLKGRTQITRHSCGPAAGWMGVHVTPLFEGVITARNPLANRLVLTHLKRLAFDPSFDFSQSFPIAPDLLVPWPALQTWIPGRVAWHVAELEKSIPSGERHIYRIAHRGASAYAPENTLRAIAAAAELGADWVELDVQISADGVPVILHDEDLSRSTNGHGRVQDWALAELKRLDAGLGERIPTLEEALLACRRLGMRPYLELKTGSALPDVVDFVARHYSLSEVILASFRPDWLAEAKALAPRLATSILFSSPSVDAVALARSVGADYVHPCWERRAAEPHRLLTPAWLERVRAAKLGIITWHEERPAEIAALRRLDVDGICSNTPEAI